MFPSFVLQWQVQGRFRLFGRTGFYRKGTVNEIKEKEKTPKLIYYYEYSAQEHDFDSHKSIEYSEEIKGLQILPSSNYKKLNILTAGYRIIKLDRIYEDIIPEFDTNSEIPKFTSSKKRNKSKK